MKLLIVSFALAAAVSAQLQPVVYNQVVEHGSARNAAILRQDAQVNPDGSYDWKYETENGISASETNSPKVGPGGESVNDVVGGYQYTAPNGEVVQVQYKAGPLGFEPVGSHIPQAPPIPELILRSLAYNAAHPQKEDEYYKGEAQKPYYTQPTPKPTYEPFQYSTPKTPYYPQPTVFPQPTFTPGFPQRPVAYTPQNFYSQGRR